MKKVIFMGTPDFASYILKGLIKNSQISVVLVVTQPDRPFGRKKELKQSEVKLEALKSGIEVFQPENIKKDFQKIIDVAADLIITVAYGQIVPKEVLEAPLLRAVNIHGSLLPKYRGGAPIHYAVINGDDKTGVTLIDMVEKMDAGDMISKKEVLIDSNDTTGDVYDKLKVAGLELITTSLKSLLDNSMNLEKQKESECSFSPNISKELELVEFNKKAKIVHNHIRGLVPFPVGYANICGTRIKLFSSEITKIKVVDKNTIYDFDETGLSICCDDYVLKIKEFQIAGKKRMSIKEYINGGLKFTKGVKI